MNGWEVGLVAGGVGLALFVAGQVFGVWQERRAWTMRAVTRDNPGATAHHCDGEFYYVVTEDVFVNEYQRRRICPPKGGSGTAPPQGAKA